MTAARPSPIANPPYMVAHDGRDIDRSFGKASLLWLLPLLDLFQDGLGHVQILD